jgi:MFS transporter, DHA2 family, multidrug resistance protein
MSGMVTAAIPAPPASSEGAAPIPWLGIFAVLLGTFISTLTGRISTFGLADIRGAVHAGFDDGAWILTASTAAQMLITPFSVWAGSIYGPRRVLIVSGLVFGLAEFLAPFSQNLTTLLALQFLSGLGSGCFIPLTTSFVLRSMPLKYWTYGVALYALSLELSNNISASLEGWYIDNFNWHWIFWQNVPLALGMAASLFWGVTPQPRPAVVHRDLYGLTTCGLGLALIYAALDQGNRLDWLNSGLIYGLILGGIVLLAAFVLHELNTPFPWMDFKAAFRWPVPLLLANISILRLTILATAYLIPYYLGGVRGFRALQIGDTLIWIAIPQLILCPLAGLVLRRFDARIAAIIGLSMIICACMSTAWTLTPLWGSDQFLLSQLIQAVGQSFTMTGTIFISVLNLRLKDALTFGAMMQFSRLFGGEAGSAFIATLARKREQHASNLLGLHVQKGDLNVQERLAGFGHLLAGGGHPPQAATGLLDDAVRVMATTQATIDGFVAISAVAFVGLVIMAILPPPPPRTPASYVPLFHRDHEP